MGEKLVNNTFEIIFKFTFNFIPFDLAIDIKIKFKRNILGNR